MLRPKIGLDWDDVIAPFNSIAIDMANKKYDLDLSLDEIDSWENNGRASVIKEFYKAEDLYRLQSEKISPENIKAVRELEEFADVYINTAPFPEFMTERAMQIMNIFPELGPQRIILGEAKNLVSFDITLDDNFYHVLNSQAQYPVLMRKPWNKNMTGLISVNNLSEFVTFVKHVLNRGNELDKRIPKVVALVGPSGSRKSDILNVLSECTRCSKVHGYSTKKCDKYTYLSPEGFKKSSFFEHTFYAGYEYGTRYEDIDSVLKSGNNAVMALDICGAMGMKNHFPTLIVYVKRKKTDIIKSIVSDNNISDDEKTLRLLSIETERKNESICDITVTSDLVEDFHTHCAEQIYDILKQSEVDG